MLTAIGRRLAEALNSKPQGLLLARIGCPGVQGYPLLQICKFLIAQSAEIGAVDAKGRQPAHWAAYRHQIKVHAGL